MARLPICPVVRLHPEERGYVIRGGHVIKIWTQDRSRTLTVSDNALIGLAEGAAYLMLLST